jgi:hypothetical protein
MPPPDTPPARTRSLSSISTAHQTCNAVTGYGKAHTATFPAAVTLRIPKANSSIILEIP